MKSLSSSSRQQTIAANKPLTEVVTFCLGKYKIEPLSTGQCKPRRAINRWLHNMAFKLKTAVASSDERMRQNIEHHTARFDRRVGKYLNALAGHGDAKVCLEKMQAAHGHLVGMEAKAGHRQLDEIRKLPRYFAVRSSQPIAGQGRTQLSLEANFERAKAAQCKLGNEGITHMPARLPVLAVLPSSLPTLIQPTSSASNDAPGAVQDAANADHLVDICNIALRAPEQTQLLNKALTKLNPLFNQGFLGKPYLEARMAEAMRNVDESALLDLMENMSTCAANRDPRLAIVKRLVMGEFVRKTGFDRRSLPGMTQEKIDSLIQRFRKIQGSPEILQMLKAESMHRLALRLTQGIRVITGSLYALHGLANDRPVLPGQVSAELLPILRNLPAQLNNLECLSKEVKQRVVASQALLESAVLEVKKQMGPVKWLGVVDGFDKAMSSELVTLPQSIK